MSTYYLDFEGGNDAADGTSYANRWLTITSGATAARIAPGDTIRVMGSKAPTSLGINGTWTNGPLPATKNIVSSTNATPIEMTVTSHGYSTGDTVVIASHTTNTNANGVWEITSTGANTFTLTGSVGNGVGGATGTVRNINNCVVRLASALTADICDCESAWTAATNVTTSVSTTFKENKGSASIAIAAGFTTGKAAFFATGTLDLSGFQQVSFWIRQSSGTVAVAGDVSIRLCTDTAGATSVHTIAVPALVQNSQWVCLTIDTGGNLNSAIKSVALYVDTDRGAQTFLIDNIIACKASSANDSLSLNSLIGKNTAGETWWGIQSIKGTRVLLDANMSAAPTSIQGYYGTTETVTTYKREPIPADLRATSGVFGAVQDSGASGSLIAFEGGWDRTNMTTQNLETWVDGRNGQGTGFDFNGQSFVSFNKISAVRFVSGISCASAASASNQIDNCHLNNCGAGLSFTAGTVIQVGTLIAAANSNGVNAVSGQCLIGTSITVTGNILNGLVGGPCADIVTATAYNNGATGLRLINNCHIKTATSHGNLSTGLLAGTYCQIDSFTANLNGTSGPSGGASLGANSCIMGGTIGPSNGFGATGSGCLRNVTISDSAPTSHTAFAGTRIQSENDGGTPGNHKIYTDGGLIFAQATTRHTASGLAWSHQPTSANRSVYYPLNLPLGPFLCAANVQVTVTCWFYRDDTGLTGRLVCKGGQLLGVSSDVIASMSGSANTWEQLSISFTPTEAGAIWVESQFYGGTTFTGIIDDMVITQGANTFTIPLDDAVLGGPFVWNSAQAGGGGGSNTGLFAGINGQTGIGVF